MKKFDHQHELKVTRRGYWVFTIAFVALIIAVSYLESAGTHP